MRYSLLFLVILFFPTLAFAHAMGVEVRLKNNQIHIEAFFHDDSPASGSLVTIEDETGNKILSSKTDKEGKLQVPAPPPGKYKIKVNDDAGHLASSSLIIPMIDPSDVTKQNILISKSPDREKFTQTPWLGVTLGLVTIVVFGFIASRLYQKPKSNS